MNIEFFKILGGIIAQLLKTAILLGLGIYGLMYVAEILVKADFNFFNIFEFPDISFREWLLIGIFLVLTAILFVLVGKK